MKSYYFTFGTRHKHPVLGTNMAHKWIRISAPNANTARTAMCLLFGPRWSFQYTEERFQEHYFPEGEYIHLTVESAEMDKETQDKHWEALDE